MLRNFTPHEINLFDDNGEPLFGMPSEGNARCEVVRILVGEDSGIKLYASQYGEVSGLPDPEEGTIYIVSLVVRAARPGRKDLASPAELVRDPAGKPMGCKGLDINI